LFDDRPLCIEVVKDFAFSRRPFSHIEMSTALQTRVRESRRHLEALLAKEMPIYGVTTGFGDSSSRFVHPEGSEELQQNLVAYLRCGTGPTVPERASRATLLIRTNSLCRGYSGVSTDLIDRLKLFLKNEWVPVTPREGSLGASGDLIPLAYLAAALAGQGTLHSPTGPVPAADVLRAHGVEPYRFKPKEGLAIVNGTSTMAGLALCNLTYAHFILNFATLCSAWMTMVLKGRTESFGTLVNESAQVHRGQRRIACAIRQVHEAEKYRAEPLQEGPVQDRYSLRCSPQVLGPVLETIELAWKWLEEEINSVSDNPLIAADGSVGTGGNFYGGYLAHSQDYLKICIAHMADLLDRQLMLLMDERQNRGLPANLTALDSLPRDKRFLHHGLKALHQSVSAITSEIMAKAIPNGIFSRSAESHNQDKVSLGMSAAVQCSEMIEQMLRLQTMVLICVAQAMDLRKITPQSPLSQEMYTRIRKHVPFVTHDVPLSDNIMSLVDDFKALALEKGEKIMTL